MNDFISFGPEDLPEPLREIIEGMIAQRMITNTGLAHDKTDDDVHPAEEQLNYGPGDLVAVTQDKQAAIEMGACFELGVVVNPEDHAQAYPDWEDRLLKSYLLLRYWTSLDRGEDEYFGWFPRASLIRYPLDQWEQLMEWLREGTANTRPHADWMITRYHEVLDDIAVKNPELMPRPIRCPRCGGLGVTFTVTQSVTNVYAMGYDPKSEDGSFPWKDLYKCADVSGEHSTHTTWHCHCCGVSEDLPDEVGLFGS